MARTIRQIQHKPVSDRHLAIIRQFLQTHHITPGSIWCDLGFTTDSRTHRGFIYWPSDEIVTTLRNQVVRMNDDIVAEIVTTSIVDSATTQWCLDNRVNDGLEPIQRQTLAILLATIREITPMPATPERQTAEAQGIRRIRY